MSNRHFLEGYFGQSVNELISLEDTHRIDSLVLAFEQALGQKEAREGAESLTTEEHTVLAIEALEREVNNGGYHQFFINPSVQYVPTVVGALRRIGCPKVAAITEEAIAALRSPSLSAAEIEAVLLDDDGSRSEALEACDNRFFEYPESIEDRLFAFIKANRGMIQL
jgi:hypothetical protein